ncbi:MAG: S8 family serine peptidase [Xanthomonadales bacterium]|nr:S8 family serine peptidase [Xanthomonadales bacterium]
MIISFKKITATACLSLLLWSTSQASLSGKYFSKNQAMRIAENEQEIKNLVIKFKDSSRIRKEQGVLKITSRNISLEDRQEINSINNLLLAYDVRPQRLLDSFSVLEIDQLMIDAQSKSRDLLSDLNSYFKIDSRLLSRRNLTQLTELLNQFLIVEIAYPDLKEMSLTFDGYIGNITLPGMTPQLINHQKYLYPNPTGVDLLFAWTQPGGDGKNSKVIVYDNSYNKNHEDLPKLFYASNSNDVDPAHGTAVLGILGAKNNKYGYKGGVYNSPLGFHRAATKFGSHADSLLTAAKQLNEGDFIVIEVAKQVNSLGFECDCNPTQANSVPLEYFPAEFDAIKTITAMGVVVVSAAGNGCVDFDSPVFEGMFSENSLSSGSVWVTASKADKKEPTCYSNFGQRIDFNAWGEQVAALGHVKANESPIFDEGPNRLYGANFGGSSSATPIVSSCLASLQSQFIEKYGFALPPGQLKTLLSQNGQLQEGVYEKYIGIMPDMLQIDF